jgi:hypothetical protein
LLAALACRNYDEPPQQSAATLGSTEPSELEMDQTTRIAAMNAYASRWPMAYACMVGSSFVGVYWLTQPLFARIGLAASDQSRAHALFVGIFFAVAMTYFARRTNRRASRSAA